MNAERRWLILSYFSNIDGMACAQHLDDRIPHLTAAGITPILLSGVCGDVRAGVVHRRVPSVAPSGLRFEARHLCRHMKGAGASFRAKAIGAGFLVPITPLYLLEKGIVGLDSQWSWFLPAWLAGRSMIRRHRPDLVYSTGGAPSAHVAAGLLSRWAGVPWIAEIQDPLVHGDWRRGRRALAVYRWVERFICRRADAVVFVTKGAREMADRRTGLGERGMTLYPGADPRVDVPAFYGKGDFCRFGHFGSLGGSRNVGVFLAALEILFRERPELAEVVRLDLYGSCDRLSRSLCRAFPYPEVVVPHGRVERMEALAAMRRSDVLLLIQNTEEFSAETIPSKIYEYYQAGRPVMGLVHKNAELAQMLSRLGHDPVDGADPEAVKAGILRRLAAWRDGTEGARRESPYTVATAAKALIGRADALVGARSAREATVG